MSPHGVQPGVEGHAAAQRGLDRERPGHYGRGEEVFRQEEPFQGQRGGRLRPIQQGQTFLRGQGDRLEAGDFQPLRPGIRRPR